MSSEGRRGGGGSGGRGNGRRTSGGRGSGGSRAPGIGSGRGENWSYDSLELMLDVIEEILPCGPVMWQRVELNYNLRVTAIDAPPQNAEAIR